MNSVRSLFPSLTCSTSPGDWNGWKYCNTAASLYICTKITLVKKKMKTVVDCVRCCKTNICIINSVWVCILEFVLFWKNACTELLPNVRNGGSWEWENENVSQPFLVFLNFCYSAFVLYRRMFTSLDYCYCNHNLWHIPSTLLYEYCVAGRLALAVVRSVRDIPVQGFVPVYSVSSYVFDLMQQFKPEICWLR